MKTIDRRLSKLENRFGIAQTKTTYVVVLWTREAIWDPLRKPISRCSKKPESSPGAFGVVDLSQIPEGLNAQETARFVREKGEGSCSTPRPMHPVFNVVLDQA